MPTSPPLNARSLDAGTSGTNASKVTLTPYTHPFSKSKSNTFCYISVPVDFPWMKQEWITLWR